MPVDNNISHALALLPADASVFVPSDPNSEDYFCFKDYPPDFDPAGHCENPDAVSSYVESLEAKNNELLRFDPYLLEDARRFAEHIIVSTPFIGMAEHDLSVLERVVTYAFNFDIPEYELAEIADDLSVSSSDEEEFIYGFMSVVSLQIAARLSDENGKIYEGGRITEDFDDFTSSIEKAIRSGEIGIEVMTTGGVSRRQGGVAFYQGGPNRILFPPFGTDFQFMGSFVITVHELYHAWEDNKAEPLTVLESEFRAYSVGEKAAALLGGFPFLREEDTWADTQLLEAMAWQEENSNWCNATPGWLDLRHDDLYMEESLRFENFQAAVDVELTGLQEGAAMELFRDFYKIEQFKSVWYGTVSSWMSEVGKGYCEGKLHRWNAEFGPIYENLGYWRRALEDTDAGTPERLEAVYAYLDEYAHLYALAYYVDGNQLLDIWVDMKTGPIDDDQLDGMAEELINETVLWDG